LKWENPEKTISKIGHLLAIFGLNLEKEGIFGEGFLAELGRVWEGFERKDKEISPRSRGKARGTGSRGTAARDRLARSRGNTAREQATRREKRKQKT